MAGGQQTRHGRAKSWQEDDRQGTRGSHVRAGRRTRRTTRERATQELVGLQQTQHETEPRESWQEDTMHDPRETRLQELAVGRHRRDTREPRRGWRATHRQQQTASINRKGYISPFGLFRSYIGPCWPFLALFGSVHYIALSGSFWPLKELIWPLSGLFGPFRAFLALVVSD